jgi:site-specific recombinase XerD
MRSFFGWLHHNGHLLHNPVEGLALPRPEQSLPCVLNESEIARLIETPDHWSARSGLAGSPVRDRHPSR